MSGPEAVPIATDNLSSFKSFSSSVLQYFQCWAGIVIDCSHQLWQNKSVFINGATMVLPDAITIKKPVLFIVHYSLVTVSALASRICRASNASSASSASRLLKKPGIPRALCNRWLAWY
jgi:hypothetical protein